MWRRNTAGVDCLCGKGRSLVELRYLLSVDSQIHLGGTKVMELVKFQ